MKHLLLRDIHFLNAQIYNINHYENLYIDCNKIIGYNI